MKKPDEQDGDQHKPECVEIHDGLLQARAGRAALVSAAGAMAAAVLARELGEQVHVGDHQRAVEHGEDDQREEHLAGGHVGETASAVFCSPKTIQGCRPISVSIQPALLAM